MVGGGTLKKAPLSSTDELKQGAIVGKDTDGLLEVLKTAEMQADGAIDATTYKVLKGHEFVVGDYILDSALAGDAQAITEIDTSEDDYDTLTVGTTLGHAVTDGECLVQVTSAGALQVTPEGVTKNAVDLSKANQVTGVMVRGTVNESLMPYPVDASVKALLPLIRFK